MKYKDVVDWWSSRNINNSVDLDQILDNFKIVFACNSNGIEGNTIGYATTRDLFEDKPLSNFSGTAREVFETVNQKYAFTYLLESLDHERSIDAEFILTLHRILLNNCYDDRRLAKGELPGTFKKHDYVVGTSDVGSDPEDVLGDLNELIDELDSAEKGDILVKAAYFHLRFETIHPFADGNGRVGRTLLNYYLLRNNYPPLVIFNEDKETYYLGLEVYARTEELKNFVLFLKEQTVKTWSGRISKRSKLKRLENFV